MANANPTHRSPHTRRNPKPNFMGVGDSLGSGDSFLVTDLLGKELGETAFAKVKEEVHWTVMQHRGGEVPRLVAVQGELLPDGGEPVYRHPSDESPPLCPFTPTVALIRDAVQKVINHPVNHVLIQHYRSGKDYISEHSDKTVDVVRGSSIVNVSLGAQRTMILKTKKDSLPPKNIGSEQDVKRSKQMIPLPHNSIFVMGPKTNEEWLHGINHDNRPIQLKTAEELFEGGERISLTFRHIGTFLTKDHDKIYGQGAKGKTIEDSQLVRNEVKESHRLLEAFGRENHDTHFDWDRYYGEGFNVLHIHSG